MLHQPSFCKSFHSNWCNRCPSTLQWPLEFPGSRVTKHYHGKVPEKRTIMKDCYQVIIFLNSQILFSHHICQLSGASTKNPQATGLTAILPLDVHSSNVLFFSYIPSDAPTIQRSDDSMTQPDASSKWGHAPGTCLANGMPWNNRNEAPWKSLDCNNCPVGGFNPFEKY